MNKELYFETDKDLFITQLGIELAEFIGRPISEKIIGKKYYDCLPRIQHGDHDALELAARTMQILRLERFRFNCLYTHILADIEISPLRSEADRSERIRVVLSPYSGCPIAQKLNQSQQLIDIGKIASTLAHGVRNPLNAIKGAVVYLRERYATEKTLEEFTEIMEDEISRLEHFISNFLSSTVTSRDHEVTDVNGLLKRIEVLTSLQIYIRQIHTAYDLGDVPPIMISTFHLEQAVMNVINNAIDALKNSGRTLNRSLCIEAPGDGAVRMDRVQAMIVTTHNHDSIRSH